jgi:hypothetical protein
MIERRRQRVPRGATAGGIVAVVAGAVIVFAAGFYFGRADDTAPDQPVAAPAGETVASAPPRVEPARATPAETGHQHPHPQPAASQEAAGPAPYEFDPPVLDFGIVAPDTEMRGSITLRNVSAQPLYIDAMKPDCKCTTVQDLTGRRLSPGESVVIDAVVEGRPTAAEKNSEIKFVFRGYGQGSVSIMSTVSRVVRGTPSYLKATEQLTGVVDVASLDGSTFRILAVDGGAPDYVDGFDPAVDEPRAEYQIGWDLTDYDVETCLDAAGRKMPSWWAIETDHPDAAIVDCQIRHVPCTLPEPLNGRKWVLSQNRVVVDQIAPGASREFTVYLKWLRDQPPDDTIREIRTESDAFDVELVDVSRVDDKITCRVVVTPKPDHRGLLYGTARFFGFTPGHSAPVVIIGRVDDVAGARAALP